jgi:hypothetical protein
MKKIKIKSIPKTLNPQFLNVLLVAKNNQWGRPLEISP